jgi:hypothetical protein
MKIFSDNGENKDPFFNEKTLPCPFCGGKIKLSAFKNEHYGMGIKVHVYFCLKSRCSNSCFESHIQKSCVITPSRMIGKETVSSEWKNYNNEDEILEEMIKLLNKRA